jgi:hypothetical protein
MIITSVLLVWLQVMMPKTETMETAESKGTFQDHALVQDE